MAEVQEVIEGEIEEGRMVENPNIQALMQISEAEVNQQIMTARAYPRSLTNFRRQMREMVTYDQETAKSCLYALKRGNKIIEGPSIRFAESAYQCWGNCRVGARITDIGDEFITAQGFVWDLEKNIALAFEVLRRITDSKGERYGDDMIMVTGNAAGSIALRNAILKGIPRVVWNESYQAARRTAVGAGEKFSEKREELVAAFGEFGVEPVQVFGLLGVKGVQDVTYEHLMFLAGIHNAIKEGDQRAEEVFAVQNMSHPQEVKPPKQKGTAFERIVVDPKGKPDDKRPTPDKVEEKAAVFAGGVDAKEDATVSNTREALEQERKLLVRAAYDELGAVTKVRDVPAMQDRVIEAGFMTVEEEKKWNADCDARLREIMQSAKGKPK